MSHPVITMTLERYLRAGRMSHRGCFACGAVSEPMPVRQADTPGPERRCGLCGQEAALPVEVGVCEGWLHVIDSDGRVLNDRQSIEVA